MKIAMLSPSPIPFTMGGAEKSQWSFCENLNKKTDNQVELIKVPIKEDNFWNIIEAYKTFYHLDLSHFDMVYCSKYPSWMIRHPNCFYHVMHCLRGLYDTFPGDPTPLTTKSCDNPNINVILKYMAENPYPEDLDLFFILLEELQKKENEIPIKYFEFPGIFIRQIVHYMDKFGMMQNHPRKYYAISETVKNRKEYFPEGANVEVIYPPISATEYIAGDYNYVFTVSRLDYAKRIDVIINAMKHVKSDIKLYIAGTGPHEEELKELAQSDPRIVFLGFVSDDDIEEYYRNSLVVPYFPYDEDYGLITIEAMKHKKPVITSKDAGGPTEFVVEGQTGCVTDLSPEAIAEKIDFFAQNPQQAKEMGEKAYQKVYDINWDYTIGVMQREMKLQTEQALHACKKIVVTSSFPIWPPISGGSARIYGLYQAVAHHFDVEVVDLSRNIYADQKNFTEHFREFSLPHTPPMAKKMHDLFKRLGVSAEDISLLAYKDSYPWYNKALRTSFKDADIVVLSQPYTWEMVKQEIGDIPFVYEAPNVEILLKDAIIPEGLYKKEALELVYQAEKECCEKSVFITTCSEKDRQDMAERYNIPLEKILLVANGVNTNETRFVDPELRYLNKLKKGLAKETVALYIGSMHMPNIEGAELIISIAPFCPNVKFMLMGTQCEYFEYRSLPNNVALLGKVTDHEKEEVMSTVDLALNPMYSGSGTNLKMFDYMSAGIPTISTDFGTRGIDRKDLFTIANTEQEWIDAINSFKAEEYETRVFAAREYMENTFDWRVIAKDFEEKLNYYIDRKNTGLTKQGNIE